MAKPSNTIARPPSRIRTVLTGLVVGAAWGAVMWAIMSALHQHTDGTVFIYLVCTTAMIGAGVAAFFGAVGVKRSGERISPRTRKRK